MKKAIYQVPSVEVLHVEELATEAWQRVSGVAPNREEENEEGNTLAKKHHWNSWDDDPVGTSAGTGKSALELPSGGKLWDD